MRNMLPKVFLVKKSFKAGVPAFWASTDVADGSWLATPADDESLTPVSVACQLTEPIRHDLMLEFEVTLAKSFEFNIKVLSTLGSGEWREPPNANANANAEPVQFASLTTHQACKYFQPCLLHRLILIESHYFAWKDVDTTEQLCTERVGLKGSESSNRNWRQAGVPIALAASLPTIAARRLGDKGCLIGCAGVSPLPLVYSLRLVLKLSVWET
ncbi:hypothetical protein EDB82DRAFT_471437 [Fusarium venenatum]|uniref:uncharacterized protein n=1 Tax=Fusarium venenatum TaxID=56646 RepID=UPI001D7BB08C|nr:hypothetical protein EDB82DRAFT_471437 [Fusarium venenatum]